MSNFPVGGEVWWCEIAEVSRRPVVVLSHDAAVSRLRRVLVAPCTTNIRGLAGDVVLEPGPEDPPSLSD
jgi:mRNA interferase MazF